MHAKRALFLWEQSKHCIQNVLQMSHVLGIRFRISAIVHIYSVHVSHQSAHNDIHHFILWLNVLSSLLCVIHPS